MALPLKSGADLYNQQALRLRLHNLGADPLEVGEGLIYYNTSTGLNTSGKARIYTGAGWKTFAFSEDLDVASNADFLALKEKVDLLAGDVDTDAIISNMKEVAAFLDGFAEDADLMTYLTTELGKKLDKTGGTISGRLLMKSYIQFNQHNEDKEYLLGMTTAGSSLQWYDGSKWNTLIHAGNVGNYALPIIDGVPRILFSGWPNIEYYHESTLWGRIGFSDAGVAAVHDTTAWRTLVHSGNVGNYTGKSTIFQYRGETANIGGADGALNANVSGSYVISQDYTGAPHNVYGTLIQFQGLESWIAQFAMYGNRSMAPAIYYRRSTSGNATGATAWKQIAFTDSNVASATKLDTPRTIWGQSFDGTGDIVNPATMATLRFRNTDGTSTSYIGRAATSNNDIFLYIPTANNFHIATNGVERMLINSAGNVFIGSNYTGAQTGTTLGVISADDKTADIFLGYNGERKWSITSRSATSSEANGFGIYNHIANAYALHVTADNNVLIGTTSDSGDKLQVKGNRVGVVQDTLAEVQIYVKNSYTKAGLLVGTSGHRGFFDFTNNSWIIATDGTKTWLNTGNVGIGNTSPTQKLDVQGNIIIPNYFALMSRKTDGTGINLIYVGNDDVIKIGGALPILLQGHSTVKGNLTATGEISCGGAGEEGVGGGGASVFQHVFTPSASASVRVLHNLGTEDIVITLYEKDATSGLWSVCLTDIEIVSANEVTITFGSTSNQEHKVVIMGGAA